MSSSDEGPRIVELEARPTVSIRSRVPMTEMTAFFDGSFATLAAVLATTEATPTGAPFGLYRGMPTDEVDVEVGFPLDRPVEDAVVAANAGTRASTLPGGEVATTVHQGSFDDLGGAWQSLAEWISAQGRSMGAVMWEVYLTEPSPDMDPAELRTELFWLLER
ncbi:MAG: GyrI-like domain-containing protein [Microthrixaceae bacterium]